MAAGACVVVTIRPPTSSLSAGTSTSLNPLGKSDLRASRSHGGEKIWTLQCLDSSPRFNPDIMYTSAILFFSNAQSAQEVCWTRVRTYSFGRDIVSNLGRKDRKSVV